MLKVRQNNHIKYKYMSFYVFKLVQKIIRTLNYTLWITVLECGTTIAINFGNKVSIFKGICDADKITRRLFS